MKQDLTDLRDTLETSDLSPNLSPTEGKHKVESYGTLTTTTNHTYKESPQLNASAACPFTSSASMSQHMFLNE